MSRDSERAASNLVCFMIGAAVGAAVALLYAPREGTETRRILGEKAEAAKGKASELGDSVSTTAREKWQTVSEKVQEFRSRNPIPEPIEEHSIEEPEAV